MKNKKCKEWIAEITDTDNEIWSTDIEGDSREDVIADGMEYAKEEGLASFRIGRRIQVGIPTINVDSILDNAYEQLYDEVGEAAEGFLNNVSTEQGQELENKLDEVFYNWVKKHKLEPTCYTIVDDEIIEVQ
ncbi:hypothetical protein [Clostridium tetani]|uniref:hypothetical protein n=1 Tax=Clostridium tetani TaxID=1513 RepID=UPI0038B2D028